MQETTKQVDLGDNLKGELPPIDVTPYIGKQAVIIACDTYEGREFEEGEGKSIYVKAETDYVDSDKRIKATKFWTLFKTQSGWGWSKESKLGQFMAKMGVISGGKDALKQLIGKKVTCQVTEKKGKQYLTFI